MLELPFKTLSVIILAAGESTRMGEPKALVRFSEKSFLETITSTFQEAGIENIFVVLGHEAARIFENAKVSSARVVVNEQYTLGQFSSFQTGVRNLGNMTHGTFLSLVDQPQIGAHVIRQLIKGFDDYPDNIVIPTFRGKRGHPTIFPKSLFPGILSSSPTSTASCVIQNHAEKIHEIEIDDEGILWNINTKNELEKAIKHFGK